MKMHHMPDVRGCSKSYAQLPLLTKSPQHPSIDIDAESRPAGYQPNRNPITPFTEAQLPNQGLPCYIILYCTILYYIMLYYIILYYIILYYVILYYIILYYTILCYTILYYTMLYYIMLYYIILYYIILYYVILYYTILYYIMLYYIILYYTILHYTILCYTIAPEIALGPASAQARSRSPGAAADVGEPRSWSRAVVCRCKYLWL